MFTGIVEELGTVAETESHGRGARLTITGPVVTSDAKHGDSISVNGVCLTVTEVDGERFTVDVVAETLDRSSLGDVRVGSAVNLERAMALGDRLGGHIVQGHVDATGVLLGERDGLTRFAIPAHLSRYLVEKGSVTVDGVSLTVVDAGEEEFSVALIPTTKDLTTLGRREPGDHVNVEVDALAKHVERLTRAQLAHLPGQGGNDRHGVNGTAASEEDNGGQGTREQAR